MSADSKKLESGSPCAVGSVYVLRYSMLDRFGVPQEFQAFFSSYDVMRDWEKVYLKGDRVLWSASDKFPVIDSVPAVSGAVAI